MIKTKIVSALEKVLAHKEIEEYPRLEKMSALMGERFAVQFVYTYPPDVEHVEGVQICTPVISGELAKYTTIRRVEHVPVIKAVDESWDDNYLSIKPGLYPDMLAPLKYDGKCRIVANALDSLWLEIELPDDCSELPDESKLSVTMLYSDGKPLATEEVTVEIIRAKLPEQKTLRTEWFYADSLALYYDVPVWSKKHWELLETFARSAVRGGVNMLLTPLTTYATNGRRMNVQLVKIKKDGDKYSFNFSRLDKWIEMCNRVGIKYFELAHICNGACNPARVWATVDGEEKQIFDYGMSCVSPEYIHFIRSLLKAFLRHMKRRGDDKRCYFHVSDEPAAKMFEQYKKMKESVADILEDYPVLDALYNIEYYNNGLVNNPVPCLQCLPPFLEANIPTLWTYYANGPMSGNYSNRHVMLPLCKTRSLGMQMYKYKLIGFLHWGFNFYTDQRSEHLINPFLDLSSERWVPAGDPFLVYPDRNGKPLESLRYATMYDVFQDIRAFELCETLYSHEEVVSAIEEELGEPITFQTSARKADTIIRIRERINRMIKQRI